MSVFGDLDINEIPDDPFYTAPGTYHCVCTDAKYWTKEGTNIPSLVVTWTIDEPSSDYHGNNIQQYFTLFLYGGDRKYTDLDANEKKTVINLKKVLREGFDLNEMEVNSFDDPPMLISREAKVTLKQNDKGYINVIRTVSKRLFEEQMSTDETSQSMGIGKL